MARADLPVQRLLSSGIQPVWTTPTVDGLMISNDGRVHVHVINDNAAALTFTVQTPNTVDGLAIGERIVTIPAGEEREFVFPPATYNRPMGSPSERMVFMDFSVFTSVMVKATHY